MLILLHWLDSSKSANGSQCTLTVCFSVLSSQVVTSSDLSLRPPTSAQG